MPDLIDTAAACKKFSVSSSTLKKMRLGSGSVPAVLIPGAHWTRLTGKKILFNLELMHDFFATQDNPDAHKKAIDNYLRSLPSFNA